MEINKNATNNTTSIDYVSETNEAVGYSVSFSTQKRLSVDGVDYVSACTLDLDSEFYYRIALTSSEYNASNYLATNIVFVDILPHIGDTGVVLNTTERLSEYQIALASKDFVVEVESGKTGEITTTKAFKVEYSSSNNPIRFNSYGEYVIGDGEWDNPESLEEIRAIKITTDETFYLDSSDTVQVIFKAKTPETGVNGEVAYNSFGVKFYMYDTETEESHSLLPAEPTKVGVTLEFDDEQLKRDQALTDLIQSIALQQTALSHILNAEAEKMERSTEIGDQEGILEINKSVTAMVSSIVTIEQLYLKFLDIAI